MSDHPQQPRQTEHRMQPQRLRDPEHQVDAYPVKDEAQRERLLEHLQANQAQQTDEEAPAEGATPNRS